MEIFYVIVPLILLLIIGSLIYIFKFSTSKVISEAKRLLEQNKAKEALSLLKNQVNRDPLDPDVHFFLGEAYYKIKNYDWALSEFKKVETFNRTDYKHLNEKKLHERLADLYLRYNKTTEAQKSLLSILEIAPNDYKTLIKIGDIFFKRGLFDNALTYYQKALTAHSNGALALFKCGEVLYHKKDYSQALGYLQGAVKNDSTLIKSNYYLGMIYKSTNNLSKAVAEFEVASQHKDVRVESLFQKALILTSIGERTQAIPTFERALKASKEDPNLDSKSLIVLSIRYHLAESYEAEKDILKALDHWEKIDEVNSDYEDVKDKLKLYSDLRVDDKLKDFLTVTKPRFDSICKKIIEFNKQRLIEIPEESNNEDFFEAVISESEGKWVKSPTAKKVIQFHRDNDPVSEKLIRNALEKMKRISAAEVIMYSSSGFSNIAKDYSETRSIKLFGRDELSEILNKIT
jgi:tetratricopeptide (TPR) repeat protein